METKNKRAKYKFVTGQDIFIRQGLITGSEFRSPFLEIQPEICFYGFAYRDTRRSVKRVDTFTRYLVRLVSSRLNLSI